MKSFIGKRKLRKKLILNGRVKKPSGDSAKTKSPV